ncbi:MAG TPA: hypothetical protein VGN88_06980, partial [Phycisphaerae bacterium]
MIYRRFDDDEAAGLTGAAPAMIVSMVRLIQKVRLYFLSVAAAGLQSMKSVLDRMRGRPFAGMPNYTLLEPGLYLGGNCVQPPPHTRAVLSVTPMPDTYSAEIYEW